MPSYTHSGRPYCLRPAPHVPREWCLCVPLPDGIAPADHAGQDAAFAELAPAGYRLVSTMPLSPDGVRRTAWGCRVTYHPVSWTYPLAAPLAAYAVAQIAGLPTMADEVMCADADGISYRTPDGRPTWRDSSDWWAELPTTVRDALALIRDIDRARARGYMWGRPYAGRALLAAEDSASADNQRRDAAVAALRAWILSHYPAVVNPTVI